MHPRDIDRTDPRQVLVLGQQQSRVTVARVLRAQQTTLGRRIVAGA